MMLRTVDRVLDTSPREDNRKQLSDLPEEILGRDFVRLLNNSSDRVVGLGIPPQELMTIARRVRDAVGGAVRGEIRLIEESGLLSREPREISEGKIIDCLPPTLIKFFNRDYPLSLSSATRRLVHLIAASYVLDRAAMDFQPCHSSDSPARKIKDVDELSRKMVLIVGATAVGKDTVRAGIVKSLYPGVRVDQPVDRDTLIAMAEDVGVVMPVKLTGRPMRPGEKDMVDYVFFDGREGRPPEAQLEMLMRDGFIPYSYTYAGHRYGFALRNIDPRDSKKTVLLPGLREKLEDPSVRMILCGGGTTPEAIYFKQLFPNATIIYLTATSEDAGLLAMERESVSRWWGRTLSEIGEAISPGITKLEAAIRGALDSGNMAALQGILQTEDVKKMRLGIPPDTTGFAAEIEERLAHRLDEVIPQVGQALMLGPKMGIYIVPNERGKIQLTISHVRTALRQRGVIEERA
jgi:hypothetical protein